MVVLVVEGDMVAGVGAAKEVLLKRAAERRMRENMFDMMIGERLGG